MLDDYFIASDGSCWLDGIGSYAAHIRDVDSTKLFTVFNLSNFTTVPECELGAILKACRLCIQLYDDNRNLFDDPVRICSICDSESVVHMLNTNFANADRKFEAEALIWSTIRNRAKVRVVHRPRNQNHMQENADAICGYLREVGKSVIPYLQDIATGIDPSNKTAPSMLRGQ
jgi:hypothetical protein